MIAVPQTTEIKVTALSSIILIVKMPRHCQDGFWVAGIASRRTTLNHMASVPTLKSCQGIRLKPMDCVTLI